MIDQLLNGFFRYFNECLFAAILTAEPRIFFKRSGRKTLIFTHNTVIIALRHPIVKSCFAANYPHFQRKTSKTQYSQCILTFFLICEKFKAILAMEKNLVYNLAKPIKNMETEMIIYRTKSTDPYFNLAREQYVLDGEQSEIFMLWRNEESVIIGKNQNAYSELNLPFIEQNKIKVVRRLTGGGAVFHDSGNVNFTFVLPADGRKTIDFNLFTRPVIDFLRAHGADAQMSGRNDILIGDKKVSGNAQCVYNGKTMHHGTLLYSADLDSLSQALIVDAEKIESKGIKSVRSRVGNIADFIDSSWSVTEFMSSLEDYIASIYGAEIRNFSDRENAGIHALSDSKYSTWDWNFGESNSFGACRSARFSYGRVEVNVQTKGGRIEKIKFSGDFFSAGDIGELEASLIGARLDPQELRERLKDVDRYISGARADDIVSLVI